MTNHFLRATKRGNPVQLSRSGKSAWSVCVPLPAEVSGPLSKFDSTFGYPIDFACCCTTSSTGSCSCAQETVHEFWTELSDFVRQFSDGASKSTLIEPLRRRFVRFYVDLPVWSSVSREPRTLTPKEYRRGLIEDANAVFRLASETGDALPWMEWPETRDEITEDDSAELFSSDVSVLSMIRSELERTFPNRLHKNETTSVDQLLVSYGPILILQIASVLDQLNLVELSEDVLEYFRRYEQSFVNIVPFSFIKRVNQTLSKRNRMKGKFFNPQMTGRIRPSASESVLSKFREKLSRLLLHKRASGNTSVGEAVTRDLVNPSSPVERYWEARRPPSSALPLSPRKGELLVAALPLPFPLQTASEGIQTHSVAETDRKVSKMTETTTIETTVAFADRISQQNEMFSNLGVKASSPVEVRLRPKQTLDFVESQLVDDDSEPALEERRGGSPTIPGNSGDSDPPRKVSTMSFLLNLNGHERETEQNETTDVVPRSEVKQQLGEGNDVELEKRKNAVPRRVKVERGTHVEQGTDAVFPTRVNVDRGTNIDRKTTAEEATEVNAIGLLIADSDVHEKVSSPPLPERDQPVGRGGRSTRRRVRIEKGPKRPPLVVTHTYMHLPDPTSSSSAPTSARWTVQGGGDGSPRDSEMEEWARTVRSELDQIINN